MPNTAEGAQQLLDALTDDELARYGEIARDQASQELERWWLQAALALAAIGAVAWAAVRWNAAGMETTGVGRSAMAALGVAAVCGYWPYRRLKNWSLWRGHCKAVSAELARRRGAARVELGAAHEGKGDDVAR
jgi:hypothetical protein